MDQERIELASAERRNFLKLAGTTALSDYPSHLPHIQALPDATTAPPGPVQW